MPKSVKDWLKDTRDFPRTLPDDDSVPYLSPSQIREVLTCGQRYEYKYIDDRDEPMGIKGWFGIAVHDGLCEAFSEWVDTGLTPALNRPAEAAEDRFWEILTEAGPDKVWEWDQLTWTQIHEECREAFRIARLLFNWFVENDWTPHAAEVEVSKRYRDFATYGWADMVATDEHGRLWVLDFKTTGQTPSHGVARRNHAFQLITYASAIQDASTSEHMAQVMNEHGPVHATAAVYAVRNKTPKVVFAPVPFHQGTRRFAEGIAHSAGDKIQFGDLAPDPISAGWKCAPDKCGFFSECPGAPEHEDEDVDISDIDREVKDDAGSF